MSPRLSRPSGTLTQKMDGQPNRSVRNPPSGGPKSGPSTAANPTKATAVPRRSPGYSDIRMPCESGSNPPAENPCRMRKAISVPALCASAQAAEATVNVATCATK